MAKIRYRSKGLWKTLVYELNQSTQHKLDDIKVICNSLYDRDLNKPGFTNGFTLAKYLYLLQEYKFLKLEKRFNQNKKLVEKIVMLKKIPRRLRPELFDEFKQKPWLFWFMFPE